MGVVPQVTSGGSPFAAGCRVGSSSYNDPLNKADPTGLRPGDGSITDGQIGAACDSVGGRLVQWGSTGSKACMEPPLDHSEGGACWPPLTPGGDALVYHQGGCGVWNVEIECARGDWIPGANFVCQHSEGIIQGLTVIALVAGTVATGGALAAAAVEIGGGTGIMFGGAALAGVGGGTVGVGGGIVVSATVAENLAIAGVGGASLTQLVHMARDTSGKSGATDVPSWARNGGYRPNPGEAPADAAKRVMDEHYGAGNWSRTGKWARELSQIAKWFARHF